MSRNSFGVDGALTARTGRIDVQLVAHMTTNKVIPTDLRTLGERGEMGMGDGTTAEL